MDPCFEMSFLKFEMEKSELRWVSFLWRKPLLDSKVKSSPLITFIFKKSKGIKE